MAKLKRIKVEGFKSIRKMDLELGDINVLIGANGSGKSNFISLFKMLNAIGKSEFQLHIAKVGSANTVLHYGSKTTKAILINMIFDDERGDFLYSNRLISTEDDTLRFGEEILRFDEEIVEPPENYLPLKNGTERLDSFIKLPQNDHRESGLSDRDHRGRSYAAIPLSFMMNCKPFQFSDTSNTASIRLTSDIHNSSELQPDAGNLASLLYSIQENREAHFKNIVSTIKLAAPFIKSLELKPEPLNKNSIKLKWKEKNSDYTFGPHQAPDGLLRFMALVTLFKQPKELLPKFIIIDEPELGLHPDAINILGALIRSASHHCQIIIATQSVNLVDQFEPEEIVVVQRVNGASEFNRVNSEDLKDYLENYSLSELWEKNVIGGGPY